MAVRQYIGARYVTKIYENSLDPSSAEWEAGVSYEPLIIVTYLNSSYMSKKVVPGSVGDPAANPDYWTQTGFYNGQIAQLQQDVADINAKLERNLLIIGNSYVNYGCTAKLEGLFDHVYKFTSGGYGFSAYTGHAGTFEDLIDGAILDSSFDHDTITDIIFVSAMGDTRAYNEGDSAYRATLNTTLPSIVTKIESAFPNATRRMVTLAESRKVPYFADNKYNTIFFTNNTFKELCAVHGLEYIGWTGFNAMFGNYFQADNYHPDTTGAAYISEMIYDAYFGNLHYKWFKTNGSISAKYTAASTATTTIIFNPDECEIMVRQINTTAGDSVTLGAGDRILTTESLTFPAPGPYTPIILYSTLTNANNGVDQDYLNMQLDADSNGVAEYVANRAPSASTVSASAYAIHQIANQVFNIR